MAEEPRHPCYPCPAAGEYVPARPDGFWSSASSDWKFSGHEISPRLRLWASSSLSTCQCGAAAIHGILGRPFAQRSRRGRVDGIRFVSVACGAGIRQREATGNAGGCLTPDAHYRVPPRGTMGPVDMRGGCAAGWIGAAGRFATEGFAAPRAGGRTAGAGCGIAGAGRGAGAGCGIAGATCRGAGAGCGIAGATCRGAGAACGIAGAACGIPGAEGGAPPPSTDPAMLLPQNCIADRGAIIAFGRRSDAWIHELGRAVATGSRRMRRITAARHAVCGLLRRLAARSRVAGLCLGWVAHCPLLPLFRTFVYRGYAKV